MLKAAWALCTANNPGTKVKTLNLRLLQNGTFIARAIVLVRRKGESFPKTTSSGDEVNSEETGLRIVCEFKASTKRSMTSHFAETRVGGRIDLQWSLKNARRS